MQELSDQLKRARVEGGVFELPPRLEIRLSGADAFRYLNGQITRDLKRLGAQEALHACILTPKGKLAATLLIRRDGEDLIVESDPALEESLMARLERYIVADDVTLSIEPPQRAFHVFGAMAAREPWASAPGIRVSRMGQEGRDLDPAMTGVVDVESLPMLDPSVVEALRIERGIPKWGAELTGETLPPEAGLDRTHIDYDRGCYPGQEVISRLKSIGRVNRLLHRLRCLGSAGGTLAPGMGIITGEGNEVGEVTSSMAGIPDESPCALGYVHRSAAESGTPLFALDPLTGSRTPLSITQVTGP
jgi:folate-binding protein YgfZ